MTSTPAIMTARKAYGATFMTIPGSYRPAGSAGRGLVVEEGDGDGERPHRDAEGEEPSEDEPVLEPPVRPHSGVKQSETDKHHGDERADDYLLGCRTIQFIFSSSSSGTGRRVTCDA